MWQGAQINTRDYLAFVRSRSLTRKRCRNASFLAILLFVSLVPFLSAAEVTLSLPLQGHYRIGRYMPVRIMGHTDGLTDQLVLRANGALTTELQPVDSAKIDAIIPWLCIRAITDPAWSTSAGEHPVQLPLHPMDEDEKLIAYAGADPDALAAVFPGQKLIRISLDVTDPLPGDITAWEALDGIVLDASAARRMEESKVAGLLASGAAVAIHCTQKPGGGWPWTRQGNYWIAKIDIAGPTSTDEADAYEPTEAWTRGWPYSFRRQVIGAAIIFAITITGASLWRSRWGILVIVGGCILATDLGLHWRNRQSVSIEGGGSIVILTDTTTQRDEWTYRSVLRPSDGAFMWQPLGRPVFAYRNQPTDIAARLHCGPDGQPLTISYHLQPRQAFALQSRSLSAEKESRLVALPITSPFRKMADRLYARDTDRVIGQNGQAGEEKWPDVVIVRPAPAP